MNGDAMNQPADRDARFAQVRALKRRRPRSWYVRGSVLLIVGAAIAAWALGPIDPDRKVKTRSVAWFEIDELWSQSRLDNVENFLHRIRPYPVRETEWDWSVVWDWAVDLFTDRGWEAMINTLAVAVAAIVLAGAWGLMLTLPAARNIASPEPFLPAPTQPAAAARWLWRGVVGVTRAGLIVVRAIPEYVLAFLLLTLLGRTAWPAVLALAIHNTGILGKLGAEVVENVEPAAGRAMRSLGASRRQLALFGLFPQVLPRFLLYFFYRWETCVREATVLGLLGFATLGLLIAEARVRLGYDDELIFFALLGAVLVLVGDFVSFVARGLVRRAA